MIWVGWRQQRTEAVVAAALVAAIAAVLVPTGLTIASAYHHDGVASCVGATSDGACGNVVGAFLMRFGHLGDVMDWLTLLPGLIGVLLAAPVVATLENGTHRLDWTQSVTRGRWLAVKLGWAVGSALLAVAAMTLLVIWWRTPFVHLQGRMNNSIFDSEGSVPMAYALFAVGLAVAIGAYWQRAVPALVVAFGAYFAARLFGDMWLRQHLLPTKSMTYSLQGREPDFNRAWIIQQFQSDRHGHAGGTGFIHVVYQPASRFWALQGAETAVFAGLGIIALVLAVRRVRAL